MLAQLLLAHLLLDYSLQGDFMAKAKNHSAPIPGVPWLTILFSHAATHALAVYLITGSLACGVAELLLHAWTDYAKCNTEISFNTDQAIHIGCKIAYVVALGVFA